MKKMIVVLALAVVAICVWAGLKDPNYSVSREIVISAPPSVIFEWINNNQKANAWMPWAESDPTTKMTYSGPAEGVGSVSTWTSEGKMGEGEARIIESNPFVNVKTQLTYTKPMNMQQVAEVTLSSTEQGTLVKWSVHGKNSFVGRIACLFMNMDSMVGREFEKGLSKLKEIVENSAASKK